jgi:acetyl-CoA carboxylase biotin carboxyl carrier protein
MNLTHEDVQEILRLLDSSPYDALDIETARFKLHLRRAASGWTQETETAARRAPGAAQPQSKTAVAPEAEAEPLEPGVVALHPPLPGTFYRAPKPGAAPFVEAGAKVEPDTVVCIIETMKLMNSVPAGVAGTVAEICAENAEFVDQGRMIMKLRVEDP